MSYTIYREITKARTLFNEIDAGHFDDIYTCNNAIINCAIACFNEIKDINRYNPTNRRYFDFKANWQLIRECKLEQVIENIHEWLLADPRYDGRNWIDNPKEIISDFTEAEMYEKGWITSNPSN